MKLLHFTGAGLDEILMIVPDEFDLRFAVAEVADLNHQVSLEAMYTIVPISGSGLPQSSLSEYRPYEG